LLSLQTESSDARPKKYKKYRGQKNKIKIFLSIQTDETSNARPSSLKSIGEKKINIVYTDEEQRRKAVNPKKV